jgi:DNA-binding TFAR19-related protein (PDSD5 family)
MLEMQRRMLQEKAKQQPVEEKETAEPTLEETLNSYLIGRAHEVLTAARSQFPHVIGQVEEVLVDAIKKGSIQNKIDGESLFQFFRQIGLPVRLQTTIRYKDHGELKTISQRLKEKN